MGSGTVVAVETSGTVVVVGETSGTVVVVGETSTASSAQGEITGPSTPVPFASSGKRVMGSRAVAAVVFCGALVFFV